jgi:DnaJ-domain-containing protein 1
VQPPKHKDYYAILGVEPDASTEELREAYRFLIRAMHPDRFDSSRQFKDWRRANSRMSAINEAYAVLNDPEKRKQYDLSRLTRGAAATNQEAADSTRGAGDADAHGEPISPRAYQMESMTPGTAIYSELPRAVQEALRQRQANLRKDQVRIPLHSIGWNYFYLALFGGYFGLLFYDAFRPLWNVNLLYLTGGISVFVGILVGRNLITLIKWHKSALKPFFYLTPIYLIKTEYNNITFLPLWKLRNEDIHHSYFHGLYWGTRLSLLVDEVREVLKFPSISDWEHFVQQLLVYKEKLRTELVDNNHTYLREHDDFHGVVRHATSRRVRLKRSKCLLVYAISTAMSISLWSAGALINMISNH